MGCDGDGVYSGVSTQSGYVAKIAKPTTQTTQTKIKMQMSSVQKDQFDMASAKSTPFRLYLLSPGANLRLFISL